MPRVKIMAQLDIAEKRLPQDGRITLRVAGKPVDVRVSTIPTGHGERVVLRLLDKQAGRLDLTRLGMDEATLAHMDRLIREPHGIVLVTGPTGSGKTTTLYAALSRLDAGALNIMTVEDPIEYDLDGINQTQVNARIEMSFARALRTILRQDPDVVMIGEIRDLETAQIAVQASLTGHLVFATLHTNDAVSAVTRLVDMGVEPFLLASSLIGVGAQRLVRKLCTECRKPFAADAAQLHALGLAPTGGTLYTAQGCSACKGSGYRGRTGIYELLTVDDDLRRLIHDRASEQTLRSHVVSRGMRSLRDDGMRWLGSLIRSMNTSRFASTLAILVGGGVPLLSALQSGARVMTNLEMSAAIEQAIGRVREGASLARALAETRAFPPLLVHLVSSGEASGKLEHMLDRAAKLENQALERRLAVFLAVLEPAMILVMGGIVLLIVLAILLPIIEINQLVR